MKTFGEKTRPTIFLTIESHKLHKEFEVPNGTVIRHGQPVKLNTAGQVVPLVAGDNRNLCIGVSMHNSAQNIYGTGLVTILMKGFSTILCRAASAAVNAGPVQIVGYVSEVGPPLLTNGKWTGATDKDEPWYGINTVEQAAATDADIFGWAIEQAGAGEDVEVVIF